MANKKINELSSRTPALSDLMIVGDPSSGYSYKCTVTALATIIETDIADGYVTINTTQTISGAKTFSNNLTLTSVANSAVDTDKFLVLNSNVVNYRTGAEVLSDIGGQAALSGTGIVKSTGGTISYLTDNSSNWNSAYDNMIVSAAVTGTTTKTLTLTQQDAGTITASWTDINTDAVTSVFGRTGAVVATEGDYTLTQLGDVTITTPSTGQVLKYNGTIWVNDTDANTGTVTSVALNTGTTGTDISVSGSPITSSGTITLNIPTASATNRGALSTTDWSTFNNKQNALTLTTTGTSGAATLVGATLNIPQYQGVLTNPVTGTGTTNYIPKFTSSSAIGNSQLVENGSTFYYDNGLGRYAIVNASAENTVSSYTTNANAYNDFVTRAATHQWRIANSERMRLDASGNLGIGTSSPNTILEANGIIRSTRTGTASQHIQIDGGDAGKSYITATGSGKELWIRNQNTTSSIIYFDQAVASPYIFAQATVERMRLDASGNLGLGVTPSAWDRPAYQSTQNLALLGLSNTSNLAQNAYYNAGWKYITTAAAADFQVAQGAFYWFNAPSGTAGNAISFTQAMTLDASGRLGLGTTSPTQRLEVSGNIQLTAKANAIQFGSTGVDGTWGAPVITRIGTQLIMSDYSGVQFGGYDGSSYGARMTVLGTGNVGIGTTSPSKRLDVLTTVNSATEFQLSLRNGQGSNSVTAGLGFGFNTVSIDPDYLSAILSIVTNRTTRAADLTFQTAATGTLSERMRITSGGAVYIGTTSDATAAGFVANTGRVKLGDGGGFELNFNTSTYAAFQLASSEKMRITSGGELLINTTSDAGDYKLQVNGNTYFNGSATINATTGNNDLVFLATTRPSIFVNSTNIGLQIRSNGTGVLELNGDNSSTGDVNINNALIYVDASASSVGIGTNAPSAKLEVNGAIKTAAPSGGTAAAWKLGERVASSGLTLNDTQYIQLDIAGTLYTLATVNLP